MNIYQCTWIHYSVYFDFSFITSFSCLPSEFQFIMKFWMFYFSSFFNLVVVLILAFSEFSLHLFLCISSRQWAIPVALDGDGESCQQNFWCTCSKSPLPTNSGLLEVTLGAVSTNSGTFFPEVIVSSWFVSITHIYYMPRYLSPNITSTYVY